MPSCNHKDKATGTSVVILGATGAVGAEVVKALSLVSRVDRLTLLGRRELKLEASPESIRQHTIDVFDPGTYSKLIKGHDTAICTLGVGQPSKVSRRQFVRADKTAVLDFANAAKEQGISHFSLLSSVGVSSSSRSFFLRTKGELEEGLRALCFDSLSFFHPSFLITSKNRYGFLQGLTLKVWPLLDYLPLGSAAPLRGIRVERLGKAMAVDAMRPESGERTFVWSDFVKLSESFERFQSFTI